MEDSEPHDLRRYLTELEEDEGAIVHVLREVSSEYELSAVVKRLESAGNPAAHFHMVRNSSFSVVAALFGTRERIARALGVSTATAVETFLGACATPRELLRAADAPVKDVVRTGDAVDLRSLPISIHSAGDSGRFITSGVTIVRNPHTNKSNAGIYRMQVIDDRQVTMNSSPALRQVTEQLARSGRPIEFATVIGHHPALLVASQARHSADVDSLGVMGALLRSPVATVPAETVDLEVPASAEIVLEGRLLPTERRQEGSFGEFTYYYDPGTLAWTCEITAITHRSDAIYLDIHPTHAEHRCLWLFPGREAKLLTALRKEVPNVRAVHLPDHGAGMTAYIALDKTGDDDARQALLTALMADIYVKHAYAVDSDVNIFDDREVLWALNVRFQADRDLLVLENEPGARMDPSALRTAEGTTTTKVGFDATLPFDPSREPRADLLTDAFRDLDLAQYIDSRS